MKRALLVVCFLASSLAAEDRSPLSIGLLASGALTSVGDYSDGRVFGARIRYEGGERWSGGFQWAGYRFTADHANALTLQPITLFAQRRFGWGQTWVPYVQVSGGFSRNTFGAPEETSTDWTAGLAGGLEWNVSDMGAITLEGGGKHFAGVLGGARVFEAGLLFSFYLPESWVPMYPEHELTLEDLESPVSTAPGEVDENLEVQGELNRLWQQVEEGKFAPISFGLGNSVLQTTSFEVLDNVGAILRRHPNVRVRVYGFVEDEFTGGQERADTLALARAEVIRTYLLQNFSLPDTNLFGAGLPPQNADDPSAPLPARITFEVLP